MPNSVKNALIQATTPTAIPNPISHQTRASPRASLKIANALTTQIVAPALPQISVGATYKPHLRPTPTSDNGAPGTNALSTPHHIINAHLLARARLPLATPLARPPTEARRCTLPLLAGEDAACRRAAAAAAALLGRADARAEDVVIVARRADERLEDEVLVAVVVRARPAVLRRGERGDSEEDEEEDWVRHGRLFGGAGGA